MADFRLKIGLMVLLAGTAVAEVKPIADAGQVRAAVVKILGDTSPVAMEIPDLTARISDPEVEVLSAEQRDTGVMVRMRCRQRAACPEFYVVLRYATAEDAGRETTGLVKQKVTSARVKPLVLSGKQMSLHLRNQNMVIKIAVLALQSGAIGDSIRVRDPESHRVYAAIITGADVAEAKL